MNHWMTKACGKNEKFTFFKELAAKQTPANPFAGITMMGEGGVTIMGLLPEIGSVNIGSVRDTVRIAGKEGVQIISGKKIFLGGSGSGIKGGVVLYQCLENMMTMYDTGVELYALKENSTITVSAAKRIKIACINDEDDVIQIDATLIGGAVESHILQRVDERRAPTLDHENGNRLRR